MGVRCVTMKDGENTYYIPLEYIKMLVAEPIIQKVPHADPWIAGISYYEGELVTYYRFGSERACRSAEREDNKIPCGIILRKDRYYLGICATEISEETELSAEELEDQKMEILKQWETGTNVK